MRPFAAAFFGLVAFQVLPLPVALVRILSPGSFEFRRLYDPGFAGTKFTTLSIAPSATLREALFLAALFILGFLVLRTVVRGRRIRTIITVLVCSGVFQALYGLFELTRDEPRLLFYKKVFSLESVTGTFVNRNHFSGYLEMIIPLALGLAAARMNMMTFGVKGFREKLLLWTSKGVLGNVLILAAVAVMSLAVVLSHSRSGLVVLGFSVFLFLGADRRLLQPDRVPPAVDRQVHPGDLPRRHGPGRRRRRRLDRPPLRPRRSPPRGPAALLGQHRRHRRGLPGLRHGAGHLRLGLQRLRDPDRRRARPRPCPQRVPGIRRRARRGRRFRPLRRHPHARGPGLPGLAQAEEPPGPGPGPGRDRVPGRGRGPRLHRFQPAHPREHGPLHRRPEPDRGHGLLPQSLRSPR
ncbi:MAG: hypothetical protein MZV64_10765 [Ignavibacteriales bacterium]|nr:hypothetical protein [Ignavibacteriales bacterium]